MFRLLGLPPVEGPVSTELFFQRVHPDDRERLRKQLDETLARRSAFEAEFRIVRPGGEVRWLSGFGRSIQASDGTPEEMHGVNYDITDRKAVQQSTEASERRFRALVENSWDGIALLDEECRIIYASPANGSTRTFLNTRRGMRSKLLRECSDKDNSTRFFGFLILCPLPRSAGSVPYYQPVTEVGPRSFALAGVL